MFNEPTIVIIQGLPPNFVKADVVKLVMQVGWVYMRVLSLRKPKLGNSTKTADILILNGSIVDKIKKHFNGFKIGKYRLTTSSRLFPGRTGRSMYELNATANQKRYYNLGHQILNETRSFHSNFCNIDLNCQHKLSSRVLAACVEVMAEIEAKQGRAMANHELTKSYRVQHPLNNDAERFIEVTGSLGKVYNASDFFLTETDPNHNHKPSLIKDAINRKLEFMKSNFNKYLKHEKSKKSTEITMADRMVQQQVETLLPQLLMHLREMVKEKALTVNQVNTNYLKIYGKPSLPKHGNLTAFLEEYKPKMMRRHREMYNLAVVLVDDQVNLHKLLKANHKIIDGCQLHISPAGTSLIEHISVNNGGVTGSSCSKEVIVITDDEEDTNISMSEVKSGRKEGDEKTKPLQEIKIEGGEGSKNLLNSNMELGMESKEKCEQVIKGEIQLNMGISERRLKNELKEENLEDVKREAIEEVNKNIYKETVENIENTKTEEGQPKWSKDEIIGGQDTEESVYLKAKEGDNINLNISAEGIDKGKMEKGQTTNDEVMEGQDTEECVDLKTKAAELGNDCGSGESDFDYSEDYKIIDEVFEDFSFDAICNDDD